MITLLDMQPYEIKKAIQDVSTAVGTPLTIPSWSCLNCAHLNKGAACSMWGEIVPISAWMVGCEHWDDAPF